MTNLNFSPKTLQIFALFLIAVFLIYTLTMKKDDETILIPPLTEGGTEFELSNLSNYPTDIYPAVNVFTGNANVSKYRILISPTYSIPSNFTFINHWSFSSFNSNYASLTSTNFSNDTAEALSNALADNLVKGNVPIQQGEKLIFSVLVDTIADVVSKDYQDAFFTTYGSGTIDVLDSNAPYSIEITAGVSGQMGCTLDYTEGNSIFPSSILPFWIEFYLFDPLSNEWNLEGNDLYYIYNMRKETGTLKFNITANSGTQDIVFSSGDKFNILWTKVSVSSMKFRLYLNNTEIYESITFSQLFNTSFNFYCTSPQTSPVILPGFSWGLGSNFIGTTNDIASVGVAIDSSSLLDSLGSSNSDSIAIFNYGSILNTGTEVASNLTQYSNASIVDIAVDRVYNKMWYRVNGETWQG
jgi:hypothetical protein